MQRHTIITTMGNAAGLNERSRQAPGDEIFTSQFGIEDLSNKTILVSSQDDNLVDGFGEYLDNLGNVFLKRNWCPYLFGLCQYRLIRKRAFLDIKF